MTQLSFRFLAYKMVKTITASMRVKHSPQCLAHRNWQVALLLSALNVIIMPVRPFETDLCLRGLAGSLSGPEAGISDLPSFQALPDEGDIIQGAAGLGAPLLSGVRRAGLVVGPGGQNRE